jgi:DNA replication licensing factor MCM7
LSYTYITPRTLLAIIRISQAMAKFQFRDLVEQQDVDQAIKLIDFSFNTLQEIHNETKNKRKFSKYFNFLTNLFLGRIDEHVDIMSAVINDVRNLMNTAN